MKGALLTAGAEALRSSGVIWLVHLKTGELIPRDLAQYAAMTGAALREHHPPFLSFPMAEVFANGIRNRS